MHRTAFLLFFLLACEVPQACAAGEYLARQARVAAPVADLRREPARALLTLEHDDLEESQLLYGDLVEVKEIRKEWVRVACVEQKEWSHQEQWEGYPGWMERSHLILDPPEWTPNLMVTAKLGQVLEHPRGDAPVKLTLSIGTRLLGEGELLTKPPAPDPWWELPIENFLPQAWWQLRLLDGSRGWIRQEEATPLESIEAIRTNPAVLRRRIVETARLFLGDPYYWGGRSAHHAAAKSPPHTAVDCSGLVGLIYQVYGLKIPRDSHEIWTQARAISEEELAPGDLVFLTHPKDPDRVNHVSLYTGDAHIIEGPGTGKTVREISLKERSKETEGRRVIFGKYIP